MAKVTYGPMVSDVRGSVAGVTFSRWKTTSYTRRKTIPANPNTAPQIEVRDAFSDLNGVFKYLPTESLAAWQLQAEGRPYTGRNHMLGVNVPRLQATGDYTTFLASPGMAGAVPPATLTLTPGVGQIQAVAVTSPVPPGWTLTGVVFQRIRAVSFSPPIVRIPVELVDLVAPYDQTFLTVPAGILMLISAFCKYVSPEGDIRYSASIFGTATAT